MTSLKFSESVVEQAALAWFEALGYIVRQGTDLSPDGSSVERLGYEQVILEGRLRDALARLNPELPSDARVEALRRLTVVDGSSVVTRNQVLHRMLVNGTIPGYGFLDLAATYSPIKNVELRFGVNNLLDKDPPLAFGGAGGGYNSYTEYDFLGRQIFAAFTVKL